MNGKVVRPERFEAQIESATAAFFYHPARSTRQKAGCNADSGSPRQWHLVGLELEGKRNKVGEMSRLDRVAENVWECNEPLKKAAGLRLEHRMTVMKLRSGELVVHSSVPLPPRPVFPHCQIKTAPRIIPQLSARFATGSLRHHVAMSLAAGLANWCSSARKELRRSLAQQEEDSSLGIFWLRGPKVLPIGLINHPLFCEPAKGV